MHNKKGLSSGLFIVLLAFLIMPVLVNIIFNAGEIPSYRHIEDVFIDSADSLLEEYDNMSTLCKDFEANFNESQLVHEWDLIANNPEKLEPLKPYNPVTNPDGYKNPSEQLTNQLNILVDSLLANIPILIEAVKFTPYAISFLCEFILVFIFTIVETFFVLISIPFKLTNF